ncbi:MAG: GPR endopeptidase, partial [Clostridia bacterium]|nr:GPR endopeptidase [Clostridia bacterium]
LTALNDAIKPSAIIVVDTLATTSVNRLGTSFQLSTSGIVPGGGVGQDKPPMNKDAFGVPTISIGVPLVLKMQGVIKDFVSAYKEIEKDFAVNEFALHSILADKKLSRLVVAPKEVRFFLDNASQIISQAINIAYGI